jgi:uncharacterized repeat protein (TIGR02543 family)
MAVDPTEGGTTDPAVGVHTYPEDETVSIEAFANAGYEFDHWTGDVADPNSASTTVTMDGDKTVTAHFSSVPTVFLADNDFSASVDNADLRANGAGQDWYESREDDPTLLTLNTDDVDGNSTEKAGFAASSSGNAYLSQEFGTAQTGEFAVQWDIYVDSILDISGTNTDRAGWMLIGDYIPTEPRTGPNSDDGERFVYMAFFRDGGGTTGTMDLVVRDRDDGWTSFTTVATGLSLEQWYTIKVECNIPAGTYDIYVDGILQATVTSRYEKTSVTHISFAQWDDGAGAFYVDNVYEAGLATQDIILEPGWNLVSFRLHPVNTAIAEVLSSISGNYDLVYAWDAGTQTWDLYDVNATPHGDLTDLDEKMDFWIHMTAADMLAVTGSVPTGSTEVPLQSGWNLVGYPSVTSRGVNAALAPDVGENYSLVYAYHAGETPSWKRFERTAPGWSNTLINMDGGWGYWIQVSTTSN